MQGFIGTGDLYMDRLTSTGAQQGFFLVGNATKVEIKPDAETKDLISRKRASAGQVLASVTKQSPTSISIVLNEYDKDILALQALGSVTKQSGAGGNVTDETLTATLDKYIAVDYQDISTVVVTDSAGTTTYTLGTDYTVHERLGMIQALSTGAITEAESLLIDYAWAAQDGYDIVGGTVPEIKVYFLLDGKNDVNGKKCIVHIYEATVKPTQGIDFLSEEFAELHLEGTLVTPTGMTEPFKIDYHE